MSTPITSMQKEHARLLDNSAASMTISGADMTPGEFAGVAWVNLTFTGCVFAGKGNIRLSATRDCKFIDCRFLAPEHDFGVMTQVTFSHCQSVGRSIVSGGDGSKGVLFERCRFSGGGAAPESHEGIGSTGETVFRQCSGAGEVLVGGTKLVIDRCSFDNMTFVAGRQARHGTPLAAVVLIDDSQGTGRWRMVDCRTKKTHVQNSSFDEIVSDNSESEWDEALSLAP
ncbi:hypothetical protein M2165_004098 [Variovorax sp. TBS-050B]|uniref:hypothetical protein n=1 Tax=Variovorax sp. TBS-050B TaxID=2940551 RepID=UPI00247632B7|nr:hypothetical protein [Variovorax sp. TBS-050B]MDH6594209.1 hypothetical protein [Variovorax sp. TBS-050B]